MGLGCHLSGLGAALLVVHLHLVLEAIIELEIVVFQGGAASGAESRVGAGAVKQETRTRGPQEDT